MIQPDKPSLLPTSSNASFEVELDEACCIKLNKSSVCFLQGHSAYYKDKNRALKCYKWAYDNDSVYTVHACVCVCVLCCNYSQNIMTIKTTPTSC